MQGVKKLNSPANAAPAKEMSSPIRDSLKNSHIHIMLIIKIPSNGTFMRLKSIIASLAFIVSAAMANAAPQLVMVQQPGCVYCERWDAEIAPAYPNTAEGQFAPLVRADLRDGAPDGITYARRISYTPTFVLVEDGLEIARIEGYPGEDFFWPILTRMLVDKMGFDPYATKMTPTN